MAHNTGDCNENEILEKASELQAMGVDDTHAQHMRVLATPDRGSDPRQDTELIVGSCPQPCARPSNRKQPRPQLIVRASLAIVFQKNNEIIYLKNYSIT